MLKPLADIFRATCAQLPALEARLLMQQAYGLARADFMLQGERLLDPSALHPLLTRRLAHEPIAYILGQQEFYGLAFKVSPATLIPRADSEIVVETAIKALENVKTPRILDLGTGSGALLITLLHHTKSFGVGVDYSLAALKIAYENALHHHVDAVFMQGDWASALSSGLSDKFDLIISNPPYIESDVMAALQQDVQGFEPHLALDGGEDGLVCYKTILHQAACLLKPNGKLVFEIGQGQEGDICALAAPNYRLIAQNKDLNGIMRALCFEVKPTL